jgi:hypothetical protein
MRQCLCIRKIVDCHDLYVLIALRSAEYVSADASEAVYCNSYRHCSLLEFNVKVRNTHKKQILIMKFNPAKAFTFSSFERCYPEFIS